jgi:protein SCO1
MLVALTGCATTADQGPVANFHANSSDGLYGAVLSQPYTMPAATLTDSHDQPYMLRKDTTRPLTLVFFGYTNCPDICGVVMADIASAIVRLPKSDQQKVGMLFVTSDPARDDPGTLRRYLDRFNPSFDGLTGSVRQILPVAKALGVPIEKGPKLPDGGYDVSHGAQIVGVVPGGAAPVVWTDSAPGHLVSDIEKILAHGVPKVDHEGNAE